MYSNTIVDLKFELIVPHNIMKPEGLNYCINFMLTLSPALVWAQHALQCACSMAQLARSCCLRLPLCSMRPVLQRE